MDLVGIPRSASHPHLPSIQTTKQPPLSAPNGIRRTFSETILTNLENGVRRQPSSASESNTILGGGEIDGILRPKSGRHGHTPKFAVSRFAVTEKTEKDTLTDPPKSIIRKGKSSREAPARSVSGSLSTFARKSWINSSRSQSPSPTRECLTDKFASEGVPPVPTLSTDPEDLKTNGKVLDERKSLRRRNTLSGKKSKRPLSALLGKTTPLIDNDNPTVPSIPKSFSTDRLPSYMQHQSSPERLPIVPRSKSSERFQGHGLDIPRKKDELWSTFRTLDGEYQKYAINPPISSLGNIDMP